MGSKQKTWENLLTMSGHSGGKLSKVEETRGRPKLIFLQRLIFSQNIIACRVQTS